MYRNITTYTKNNKQLIWIATWDKKGNRVEEEHEIRPYLYIEDTAFKDSQWKSMYDKPLRFLDFNTSFERKEWIKTSLNIPLFEKFSPERQYLIDAFCGKERDNEFMKFPLRVYFIDIEVEVDAVFPEPSLAEYPINVISLYDTLTNTMHVWTYRKDISACLTEEQEKKIKDEINSEYEKELTVKIYKFDNEIKLLDDFLQYWEKNIPDVVSGWNIDRFDIPYIINRIRKKLPEDFDKRLSPNYWHKFAISTKKESYLKELVMKYHIMGISLCDYMNLYKKFTYSSQQSYKLDYIAKIEIDRGKLDYYDLGYDSMRDFMQKDFATFVKYNIIDTILVKQIDDSKKFIDLMRRICNMGLCPYETIFKTTPYILGMLCIEARKRGVKFLTDSNKGEEQIEEADDGFEGAFVFDTIAGFYQNGVMSFDFNSLYPNTIATVNISPETMVGKVVSEIGENKEDEIVIKKPNGQFVKMSKEKFDKLLEEKCTISAANVLFVKPEIKRGLLPSFLIDMYDARKSLKNKAKKFKKTAHELGEEIKELERQLAEMQ